MNHYGSDLSLAHDLDPMMIELSGDDPLVVAQSAIRRLQTPRGGLIGDPDYGYDVRALLKSPDGSRRIGPRIQAELLKDDRLSEVQVAVHQVGRSMSVAVQCTTTTGARFGLVGSLTNKALRLEVQGGEQGQ